MVNFSQKTWINIAIAGGCWGLLIAFMGGAVPALRGGVIILYMLAIAACLLLGVFIDTNATDQDAFYMSAGDRITTALLPGVLVALVIILIGVWGAWIAVH